MPSSELIEQLRSVLFEKGKVVNEIASGRLILKRDSETFKNCTVLSIQFVSNEKNEATSTNPIEYFVLEDFEIAAEIFLVDRMKNPQEFSGEGFLYSEMTRIISDRDLKNNQENRNKIDKIMRRFMQKFPDMDCEYDPQTLEFISRETREKYRFFRAGYTSAPQVFKEKRIIVGKVTPQGMTIAPIPRAHKSKNYALHEISRLKKNNKISPDEFFVTMTAYDEDLIKWLDDNFVKFHKNAPKKQSKGVNDA